MRIVAQINLMDNNDSRPVEVIEAELQKKYPQYIVKLCPDKRQAVLLVKK